MASVFVVNLPASIERKVNISRQLDTLGVAYTVFEAINGRDQSAHPLFSMYRDELSQASRGKSLTQGQLGCYASHFLLWEKCIDLNEPIIILEDDALLFPEFKTFLTNINILDERYECIRLFKNKRRKYTSKIVENLNGIEIHKFSKGHMSATGYYLTPTGARKFLKSSESWYVPVDICMDRFWANRVECYGTVPVCLTNDPIFDSDIGYGPKQSRSIRLKMVHEWYNFRETCKRLLHNLRYIFTR